MLLSPTKPRMDFTFATSKLLTPVFTLRTKREPVMQAITLPLPSLQKHLKISPLFTESEMWLEFTELNSESTISKDSSMLMSTTIAHGVSSLLISNQHSKKLEDRSLRTKMLLSLILARSLPSTRMKQLSSATSRSGLTNTLVNTMSLHLICTLLWTRFLTSLKISMSLPRSSKSLKWTSTQTNLRSETKADKPGSFLPSNSSSLISE